MLYLLGVRSRVGKRSHGFRHLGVFGCSTARRQWCHRWLELRQRCGQRRRGDTGTLVVGMDQCSVGSQSTRSRREGGTRRQGQPGDNLPREPSLGRQSQAMPLDDGRDMGMDRRGGCCWPTKCCSGAIIGSPLAATGIWTKSWASSSLCTCEQM